MAAGRAHVLPGALRGGLPGREPDLLRHRARAGVRLRGGAGRGSGAIALAFDGAERLRIDAEGDLVLATAAGEVRFRRPVIYQDADGIRRPIDGGYVLEDGRVRFRLAAWDASRPLVIDPVLGYSTFLGGASSDQGFGIAIDADGNAYVTGSTVSADFPISTSAVQGAQAGVTDVFVGKLDPSGSSLVYSTFLGGSGDDAGTGIAVDALGNAFVTGTTNSINFPVQAPFQAMLRGGNDAFVVKHDPAGSALIYSTYLGSNTEDVGNGIAIDAGRRLRDRLDGLVDVPEQQRGHLSGGQVDRRRRLRGEAVQVTIMDNDFAGDLNFHAAAYTVREFGTANLSVRRRSNATAGPVTVSFATVDVTARAGIDYVPKSGVLTFAAGAFVANVSVEILGNKRDDGDRVFNVVLSSPTGGATLGMVNVAPVTITDNDAGGVIQFSPSTFTVSECATLPCEAVLTVVRNDGGASNVSVDFATVDGTASALSDYVPTTGTVQFGADERLQRIRSRSRSSPVPRGPGGSRSSAAIRGAAPRWGWARSAR